MDTSLKKILVQILKNNISCLKKIPYSLIDFPQHSNYETLNFFVSIKDLLQKLQLSIVWGITGPTWPWGKTIIFFLDPNKDENEQIANIECPSPPPINYIGVKQKYTYRTQYTNSFNIDIFLKNFSIFLSSEIEYLLIRECNKAAKNNNNIIICDTLKEYQEKVSSSRFNRIMVCENTVEFIETGENDAHAAWLNSYTHVSPHLSKISNKLLSIVGITNRDGSCNTNIGFYGNSFSLDYNADDNTIEIYGEIGLTFFDPENIVIYTYTLKKSDNN